MLTVLTRSKTFVILHETAVERAVCREAAAFGNLSYTCIGFFLQKTPCFLHAQITDIIGEAEPESFIENTGDICTVEWNYILHILKFEMAVKIWMLPLKPFLHNMFVFRNTRHKCTVDIIITKTSVRRAAIKALRINGIGEDGFINQET